MNSLIPIAKTTIGQSEVNTVNARELHDFLEVSTPFKDWIVRRLNENSCFVEDEDYTKIVNDFTGAEKSREFFKGRFDYFLTLDMAKELSMLERNGKGRQARKYFIACEKELREQTKPIKGAKALLVMIQQMVDLEEAQEEHDRKLKALEEKVDRNLGGTGFFTIVAYGKKTGARVPTSVANMLGKRTAKLSRERGVIIGKAPDEKWGEVGSYREDLLKEVFDKYLTE